MSDVSDTERLIEAHNVAQRARRDALALRGSVRRLRRCRGEVTGVEAERLAEVEAGVDDVARDAEALVEATRHGRTAEEIEALREQADEDAREAVWS